MSQWLLVLGANSDMALAIAHKFASNGYNLLLASRDINNLEQAATDIRIRYNIEAIPLYFDAEKTEQHQNFYQTLPHSPNGVIVAFGYLGDQLTAQKDFAESKKIISTNYTGAVSILEIIATDFESKQQGFIAGISSVAGDRGRASNYIYGSAKAGFSAYLAGLRHRLFKNNVAVTTIKPGFVATKMTSGMDLPSKLTATPQQVADLTYKAIQKKSNTVYIKPIWFVIMLVIKHLPEFIFKRSNL